MQFIDSIANGGKWVWGLLILFALATTGSVALLNKTAVLRYERDVNRMVFNDNLGVLEEVRSKLGTTEDCRESALVQERKRKSRQRARCNGKWKDAHRRLRRQTIQVRDTARTAHGAGQGSRPGMGTA